MVALLLLAAGVAAEPALGPLELRSASGDHALQIGFAGQLRATFSDSPAGGERAQDLTLEARRVRPMLRGSFLRGGAELFLHLSTAPGSLELVDLFVQLNLHPQLRLRIGQFKTPYTRYRMQFFPQMQFVDWSLVSRYLGAERQLGVALHNGYERGAGFDYALGVFSGVNARRSHGVGLGLLYGERLPNPSDLTAPQLPTRVDPLLALRLGYTTPGLRPEVPSDAERGPLRGGASLSATYDPRPARTLSFALRVAPEVQVKVRGVSLHAAGYLALFQGDGGPGDLRPAFYGAMAQAAYQFHPRWQVALRYGVVLAARELREDAQARARALVEAAAPSGRAALEQQYQSAGALEQDQELTLAGERYVVGHSLKAQLDASWLQQRIRGATQDGARLRLQLQVAF